MRCLECDASLLVIEEYVVGIVLNIERRSRVIPMAMELALSILDVVSRGMLRGIILCIGLRAVRLSWIIC